jgi:hypothetical protein
MSDKMTSIVKVEANRKNGAKSKGPKTDEGKAGVRMNALKHGLVAKELIIQKGDAKEDEAEFAVLLHDLCEELVPVGTVEEMLVERISACYWRLRRAARFEVGVLREELDRAISDYKPISTWKEKEVNLFADYDSLVDDEKRVIRENQHCIKLLKDGLALDREPDEKLEINLWGYYEALISLKYATDEWTDPDLDIDRFDEQEMNIEEMRAFLIRKAWTDKKLRENFVQQDLDGIKECEERLEELARRRGNAELKVSRLVQAKSLPDSLTMDRILRYETAIERQMYKALDQLERLQRQRAGDNVPPPISVQVTSGNG